MMMMEMCMYFYQSTKVKLIWAGFDATTGSAYFGALVTAFLFGFFTESLNVLQDT